MQQFNSEARRFLPLKRNNTNIARVEGFLKLVSANGVPVVTSTEELK